MNQTKANKLTQCPRCQGDEYEANDQGFYYCVGCNLIQEQYKFDSNVVFG